MLKNKIIALSIAVINLLIVLLLIGFVIENRMIQVILGLYAIVFSSVVSFMLREKLGD
jgi:hypothetical protein